MNTPESKNLLEVWDKLCLIINNKGSLTRIDPNTTHVDHVQFNQIKLNRASALWQALMEVLEPLSVEEVEVLLDLAKPNNTHAVYQAKVSMAAFVSIPVGLISMVGFFMGSFNPKEHISLISGATVLLIFGAFLLYKQLSYRWFSMELGTCLEMVLAMKKAERIKFQKYELPQFEEKRSKIVLKKTPINLRSKK